jgi:hypothetical protein
MPKNFRACHRRKIERNAKQSFQPKLTAAARAVKTSSGAIASPIWPKATTKMDGRVKPAHDGFWLIQLKPKSL